jgi:hypothetical protein
VAEVEVAEDGEVEFGRVEVDTSQALDHFHTFGEADFENVCHRADSLNARLEFLVESGAEDQRLPWKDGRRANSVSASWRCRLLPA